MRLVKYLANAGVASRRASEQLIAAGRVTVDGRTVTDPATGVGEHDDVRFDGARVTVAQARAVYVVNKPAGVVSTASDPQRRPSVVGLVDSPLRLYPVGRLDIDTTGLILLTNDGELAHRLTHPSFELPRTYRVQVARAPITDAAVRRLRAGVRLEDGMTAPARVRRTAPDTLELTIHEGRNRQVKRMCDAVGHRVKRLQRVAFGPLTLGDLRPGQARRLTGAELQALAGAGTRSVSAAGRSTRRAAGSSSSAPPRPAHG